MSQKHIDEADAAGKAKAQAQAAEPVVSKPLASATATKEHKDVEVREDGGKLIYSAKGVDLLAHAAGSPTYTLLVSHPPTEGKAGQVKQLCEPFDEQCACTARDLANSLASSLPDPKKT